MGSPYKIQEIGTSSKGPSNISTGLLKYILDDANQLRFIDENQFEAESLVPESCVKTNLEQESQQIGSESDANNSSSPINNEHESCSSGILLEQGIPKLGMEFDDAETAYGFYNSYGAKKGFSIKKDNTKTAQGVIKFRSFCCSKEGARGVDKRDTNVVHHRPETRTGCQARMHIRLYKNGKYKVTKLELEHNHSLASPGKAHMLRSQRKLGKVQKSLIDAADKSGLTPKQAFDYQATVVGGRENLGCLSVDVKNYLRTKRQKEMEKGDVASLMQYFHNKQLENKSFYSNFQVDKEDQITNIFWADAKGIVDYSHFGDVVCFDTTYRINNYGRPVAPILGINHHKQTIIFGVAILYDETAESFEWLFECFLEVMSGVQPKTILTDQCAAMAKAIAKVLPDTHHRLCIWHIYQNACTNLQNVFSASLNFAADFSSCIYDHEVEEEFVKAWNDMLKEYDLVENKWLNDLFEKRRKWALVYGRNTFCADMMSTQRSESINAVLKRYVNSQYNLLRFCEHYDRLVADRRYEEYYADFVTSQTRPVTYASSRMLKQASEVYTNEVYKMFEKEYKKFLDCDAYKIGQTDTIEEYDVGTCVTNHSHKVKFDSVGIEVMCSCKKYEFVGILCSHALKVLDYNHIKFIPDKYVMKRWTKDAKIGNVNSLNGEAIQSDPSLQLKSRYGILCSLMVRIATLAAEHEDTFEFAMENSGKLLEGIEKKLKTITIGETSTKSPLDFFEAAKSAEQSSLPALPIRIKRKENERGRRRIPSSLEKSSKKNNEKKTKIAKGKKAKNQEMAVQEEESRQMNIMQIDLTTQAPEMMQFQMLQKNNLIGHSQPELIFLPSTGIMQLAPSHANNSSQIYTSNMNQPMISYAQLLQGVTLPNKEQRHAVQETSLSKDVTRQFI